MKLQIRNIKSGFFSIPHFCQNRWQHKAIRAYSVNIFVFHVRTVKSMLINPKKIAENSAFSAIFTFSDKS